MSVAKRNIGMENSTGTVGKRANMETIGMRWLYPQFSILGDTK
jgi:hypothetical protein